MSNPPEHTPAPTPDPQNQPPTPNPQPDPQAQHDPQPPASPADHDPAPASTPDPARPATQTPAPATQATIPDTISSAAPAAVAAATQVPDTAAVPAATQAAVPAAVQAATKAPDTASVPAATQVPDTASVPTATQASDGSSQPPHSPLDPEPRQPEYTSPSPAPRRDTLRQLLSKATGHDKTLTPEQQINRRTFVSFTAFTLLGVAAWKSWFWIKDAAQSDGVQSPLRKILNADDKVFKHTLSPNHLAKTYPREQAAKNVRYNSGIGLGADPASWRLQVTTIDNQTIPFTLDDLKALPKTDFAFEFKCIEGWSQVSWWGGVRFSDFINHYKLQREVQQEYVGLSTPDNRYYVGVDSPSMMHPQTLLAYEMNGQPLPTRHGAPLRLIIPIKYGVKNLKCVGKLFFSNSRPRDYWFERGYDYYCGL